MCVQLKTNEEDCGTTSAEREMLEGQLNGPSDVASHELGSLAQDCGAAMAL